MKQWWLSRSPQDRMAISSGAAALMLLLLYLLVWIPFSQKVEQKRILLSNQQSTLTWMRERAAEVRQLKAVQTPVNRSGSREALLTLVDRTAKQSRLRQQIQRLKPEGNDSVQLWMEEAPFDTLIMWLGKLSVQHGISVESLNIERLDNPGQVNARLNLYRESS